MIGCGRGSFELTGYEEEEVVGQPLSEALGLSFEDGEDHIGDGARVGRAGARQAGDAADRQRPRGARPRPTSSRPTTTTAACCSCSRRRDERPPPQRLRPRASSPALVLVSLLVVTGYSRARQGEEDAPRPRPPGRRRADLPGQPTAAVAGQLDSLDRHDQHHPPAHRPARRGRAGDPALGQRPDRRQPAERQGRQPGRTRRSARRPSCTSTTGRPNVIGPNGKAGRPTPTVTGGQAPGRLDLRDHAVPGGAAGRPSGRQIVPAPERPRPRGPGDRAAYWYLVERQAADGARRARADTAAG